MADTKRLVAKRGVVTDGSAALLGRSALVEPISGLDRFSPFYERLPAGPSKGHRHALLRVEKL